MTPLRYIINNLKYYRGLNTPVFLGVVLCSMVLSGALMVGDSVKQSLSTITSLRLGKATHALHAGEHYVTEVLAEKLTENSKASFSAILQSNGVVSTQGGQNRANGVQILGIDENFWAMSPSSKKPGNLTDSTAAVNYRLAKYLNISIGDEVLIRLDQPSVLPKDVPLTSDAETTTTLRIKISSIADDQSYGRFSLKSDQVIPFNLYLGRELLAKTLEQLGAANLILTSTNGSSLEELESSLKKHWTLADIDLKLISHADNQLQLDSKQVFLPSAIGTNYTTLFPQADTIFTYFVNKLSHKGKSTPYSFVSSLSNGPQLSDSEIIISDWLAEDLGVKIGDSIELTYYIIGKLRRLEEKTRSFTVKSIVPIKGWAADRNLTPNFPGLSDSENCSDWDPGLPVDTKKIRNKDEAYWDNHHATPKAFVSINAARQMWSNRFGSLTSLRFDSTSEEQVSQKILNHFTPADFGLGFIPVQASGLTESQGGVDFSGLFIGLSFFIITSALMIMGMLFVFNIQSRASDSAVLRTIGFDAKTLTRFALYEGGVIVIVGSFIGALLGVAYNYGVIYALTSTDWQGAVNAASLKAHTSTIPLLSGITITSALAFGVIVWLIRRQHLTSIRTQLTPEKLPQITSGNKSKYCAIASLTIALLCIAFGNRGSGKDAAGLFFGAGFQVLFGLTMLAHWLLIKMHHTLSTKQFSQSSLPLLTIARRLKRSITAISSLACGVFLIIAVASNQKSLMKNATTKQSGTGGFAWFIQTAIPVIHDLNSEQGQNYYGIDKKRTAGFVQLSVKTGDDASCLNLNRVTRPQLVGVNPKELAGRFSLAKTLNIQRPTPNAQSPSERSNDQQTTNNWELLNADLDDDVIPAVADMAVIQWGLGKALGDEIEYADQFGKPFKVRLVGGIQNSVFQGNLIIAQKHLTKHFPSLGGSTIILVDHNSNGSKPDQQQLRTAFEDAGGTVTSTAERLAMFSEVENTYLRIFLALGGLGVIIGTAGLGVVTLRSITERRNELAAMRAIGYTKRQLVTMIIREQRLILLAGVVTGSVSAFIAVLPALLEAGNPFPLTTVLAFIAVVVIIGLISVYAAVTYALRGELLSALRSE